MLLYKLLLLRLGKGQSEPIATSTHHKGGREGGREGGYINFSLKIMYNYLLPEYLISDP
jgi:hypothetical protein